MSSKGNCYDNAMMESFFHTLKTERVYWEKYYTREQAKRSIFEYIEIKYNRNRLHSAIQYKTPIEFVKIPSTLTISNIDRPIGVDSNSMSGIMS